MGAGILPIAFYEGKLYFLFGEECSERKWFDFGGGKENGESNINTAIRECYEELDGFIGTMTELKQLVKERLLLKINFENYTTFLIQIDYNSKLPFYFNNHHKFIKHKLPDLICQNGLFEKRQIKWMTIDDLKKKRYPFRPYYKKIIEQIIYNYDYLLDAI